jgi:hypothetical protein
MARRWFCIGLFWVGLLWVWPAAAAQLVPAELLRAREALTAHLNQTDADCAQAAERLGRTGLTGQGAREVLAGLCAAYPEAVDCAAVDLKGRMVTVEPAAWRIAEGADISSQEQVIALRNTRKPILSRLFRSVEGFEAVDLEYPVFSPQQGFIGSLSMLIRPEPLLERVLGEERDVIRVIQEDGCILFSPDKTEIGRTLPPEAAAHLADRFFLPGGEQKAVCSSRGGDCSEPESARTDVRLHGTLWQIVIYPRVAAGR